MNPRARLHLISPPWAYVWYASLQLGALHSYIDRELGRDVETRSYSAFLEILYRHRETACCNFFERFRSVGEEIYMLIYHRRYLSDTAPLTKNELEKYIKRLNKHCSVGRPADDGLSLSEIEALERHTLAYVDEVIVPNLSDEVVNVIGFSMNFFQVYPSAVMARMIQERAKNKKLLFLFGGFSASLPNIFSLLSKLGIEGYAVFGEGEKRLSSIFNDLLSQKQFTGQLNTEVPGVFRIGQNIDLFKRDEKLFKTQISDLAHLPLPNFDEYFKLHEKLSENDPLFARMAPTVLPFEGSRGCFAKCDFCNMNLQWSGFRKLTASQVLERVRAQLKIYPVRHLSFVDNVCDTWAEHFADEVILSGDKFQFYMDLRAHHPEKFWAKLAAAGMNTCLVGVEALSGPLLAHMTKGTLVVQNLRVIKALTEFGVRSYCGIITHHPRSTREDALETLRVLSHLTHLEPFEPRPYYIGLGSPLHDRLSHKVKIQLKPFTSVDPPQVLSDYIASGGYEVPAEYRLSSENSDYWGEIADHCAKFWGMPVDQRPIFTVRQLRNGDREVFDTRFGERKVVLKGLRAKVFDLCHDGLKLEMLKEKLGDEQSGLSDILSDLVREKLILESDGYFITLAVRPKQESFERLGIVKAYEMEVG